MVVPRRWSSAALGLALILSSAAASAQTATLLNGFGGLADFGVDEVPRGDDLSSPEILLGTNFPNGVTLNGQNFASVDLNINGNISFGSPLTEFTPTAFPGATVPMIAAWWADVDTRLADAGAETDGVYWHLETGRLVATWFDVGYFDQHRDLQNSFQIIMTDAGATGAAPGDVDIEFRYNRCEWTTGDASGGDGGLGGTIAFAGYDFTSVTGGSPTAFSVLPGSGTPGVQRLCTESNVGLSGVWRLQVRAGVVVYCGNGVVDPGEECDPAAPPFMGCTPDCRVCADPSCGSDGGPPDVFIPDVFIPDAGEFDVVEPMDALGDSATPMDATAIDGGMDAGLDGASTTDSGERSVSHYGGGGLFACAVPNRVPGRRGIGVIGITVAGLAIASTWRRRRR